MMAKHRTIGLIAFIKGTSNPADKMPGCADFDFYHRGCLYAETCLVHDGNRCKHFEEAVLPTAADIGQIKRITKLYQRHVGIEQDDRQSELDKMRKCPDCEAELKPRQRYCSDCKRKRMLETKRKTKRKRQVRSR